MYISSICKPQGLFPREIQGSGIGNSLEEHFHSNLSLPQKIYQNDLFLLHNLDIISHLQHCKTIFATWNIFISILFFF